MHLSGTRSVNSARQRVWDTLQNPEELRRCMPGCEEMRPLGPDEYAASMTVKIASIGGSFQGKIALKDKIEPSSYVMSIEGGGKPGRVTGQGTVRLEERQGGTEIVYEGDVQIAGAIAAVGQRLIGVTARLMIGKFFDCMEGRLGETSAATGG
jgi:carbon monoxide dehydrogenase subunit G